MKKATYSTALAVNKRIPLLPLLILLLACGRGFAQENPLNRKIILRLDHVRLDDALIAIGDRGGFNFSYNSQRIPADSLVNVDARRTPVRKVLEGMLGERIRYEQVGNHIVLRERKAPPPVPHPPKFYNLTGYLLDAKTGEKIRFASVFEADKQESVLTDPEGKYRIRIPGDVRQVALSFSKRGYRDTVIVVRPDREQQLIVGLQPIPQLDVPVDRQAVSLVGDSYHERLPLVEFFVPEKQRSRSDNVLSALQRIPVQISLVPSIGTNRLMSGAMNNVVSINLLAGYANGVRGVEAGGLVNIDRVHVYGVQMAGVGDIVGGDLIGVQAGGVFNHVRGRAIGVQLGGVYNHVGGPVTGVQAGGVCNYVRDSVTGIQVGGVFNYGAKGVKGAQIGGVYNHANGNVHALQVGGVANYGHDIGLFQIAGVTNVARGDVKGFQVGGVVNVAQGDVKGFQIAGVVNRAKRVDGFQIGIVNIADTVGGAAIGLVSAIRTGYKSVEVSTNEVLDVNVAFKSGGPPRFYTTLAAGLRFRPGSAAFAYGAGIGTLHQFGRFTLGLDLLTYYVAEEDIGHTAHNLLFPARLNLGFRLTPSLELYAGASASLHWTDARSGLSGEFISGLGNDPFWRWDDGYRQLQAWTGYQGGLRINFGGLNPLSRRAKKPEPADETRPD